MATKGKGSFRGQPFYTVDHELTGGRRQPTYEMPYQSDGARSMDLGRKARKYRISCYVAGDDFRGDANRLLDALEQEGPGVLIHPVYGRMLVTIGDDVQFRESTKELRKVTISFTATEAVDDEPTRTPRLDTAGALRKSSQDGLDVAMTVATAPETGLVFPFLSDFVKAAHLDVLDTVLADLRLANAAIASVLSIPSGFASQIDLISQDAASLITTPDKLFASVFGAIEKISAAVNRIAGPNGLDRDVTDIGGLSAALTRTADSNGSLLSSVGSFAGLGSSVPAVPAIDTPERAQQRQGQSAIILATRSAGLLSLSDAAIDARYDSANDARRVRDALAAALSDLADGELEPDVQLSAALKDAAAKVIAHLSRIAGSLAEVGTYTPKQTLPIEVIAWQLYGDSERADEIVLENRGVITNPGAVSGFIDLEVRSF